MKKLNEKTVTRSLAKGMLAGLIGGLVATAAKTLTEKIYRRRTHGEPDPLAILAEKLVGHELVGTQKTAAVETLQWGFGALTGAAYGALARILSASYSEGRRRIWNGVDFSNSWNRTSCTGSSRRCARANNARTHQRDGHPRRVRSGDRDSSSESKKDVGVESQMHGMSEPWHSFLAST